jgi:glycine cleavage system aminomethyltransferase T
VMLLLDNVEHDLETQPWPWGGEPIYRDGKYVGSVTTTSYGFSLKKHVAIGFVHRYGAIYLQGVRTYLKSRANSFSSYLDSPREHR